MPNELEKLLSQLVRWSEVWDGMSEDPNGYYVEYEDVRRLLKKLVENGCLTLKSN